MISIVCTSCRAQLQIDEAFVGGVCRCQHCGTIQTVPKQSKDGARPATPGAVPGSKALYQRRANSDAGTGLDQLADAVASSSGLSSRRLRTATATATATKRKAAAPRAARKLPPMPLLIGGSVTLAALILFGVIYLMHDSSSTPNNAPQAGGNSQQPDVSTNNNPPTENQSAAAAGPSFCGVPLNDASVVYILDRGSATEHFFDPLKSALYHSLARLGPGKKFAVILTDNGSANVAYPATGLADATAEQTQQLHTVLDDTVASGAGHFRWAFQQAVDRHPAIIVLVTAKYLIADDDVQVLKQYSQQGIVIDTFMIGDSDAITDLKDASSHSGGTFSQIKSADLDRFAE